MGQTVGTTVNMVTLTMPSDKLIATHKILKYQVGLSMNKIPSLALYNKATVAFTNSKLKMKVKLNFTKFLYQVL